MLILHFFAVAFILLKRWQNCIKPLFTSKSEAHPKIFINVGSTLEEMFAGWLNLSTEFSNE